ncbi:MAG: hypothetical protein ACR65W_07505 [Methylocystis sp.]|uniref:hypothetical protein n=1 Tax=Methylocystis sp. TaxID=1911079 RepID=UPI003DA4A8C4
MSDVPTPQHAPGLSGRELDRVPRAGAITPQSVVFERLNGERLHFASVAAFHEWLDAEQRRETLAEENARPA